MNEYADLIALALAPILLGVILAVIAFAFNYPISETQTMLLAGVFLCLMALLLSYKSFMTRWKKPEELYPNWAAFAKQNGLKLNILRAIDPLPWLEGTYRGRRVVLGVHQYIPTAARATAFAEREFFVYVPCSTKGLALVIEDYTFFAKFLRMIWSGRSNAFELGDASIDYKFRVLSNDEQAAKNLFKAARPLFLDAFQKLGVLIAHIGPSDPRLIIGLEHRFPFRTLVRYYSPLLEMKGRDECVYIAKIKSRVLFAAFVVPDMDDDMRQMLDIAVDLAEKAEKL